MTNLEHHLLFPLLCFILYLVWPGWLFPVGPLDGRELAVYTFFLLILWYVAPVSNGLMVFLILIAAFFKVWYYI